MAWRALSFRSFSSSYFSLTPQAGAEKSELILEPLVAKPLLRSAALPLFLDPSPPAPPSKSQTLIEKERKPQIFLERRAKVRAEGMPQPAYVVDQTIGEARNQVLWRVAFLVLPLLALFGSLSILPFLSIRIFLFAATGVILMRAIFEVTDRMENYFQVTRAQVRMGLLSKFELFRTGSQSVLIGVSLVVFTLWGFQLFLANLPKALLEAYGFFFFGFFAYIILIAVGLIWTGHRHLYLQTMHGIGLERRRYAAPYQHADRRNRNLGGKAINLGPLFSH